MGWRRWKEQGFDFENELGSRANGWDVTFLSVSVTSFCTKSPTFNDTLPAALTIWHDAFQTASLTRVWRGGEAVWTSKMTIEQLRDVYLKAFVIRRQSADWRSDSFLITSSIEIWKWDLNKNQKLQLQLKIPPQKENLSITSWNLWLSSAVFLAASQEMIASKPQIKHHLRKFSNVCIFTSTTFYILPFPQYTERFQATKERLHV